MFVRYPLRYPQSQAAAHTHFPCDCICRLPRVGLALTRNARWTYSLTLIHSQLRISIHLLPSFSAYRFVRGSIAISHANYHPA
ncbi:unnamed protein product, partial [Trichogramma brassicae]